jgi:hypothetical protein
MMDGGEPPQQAAFAQVMTLGAPAPNGDYIGVVRPPGGSKDQIVRTLDTENWQDLSDAFGLRTIFALAASGGHQHLVLYVLTTDGMTTDRWKAGCKNIRCMIYKGRVDGTGRVPSWTALTSVSVADVFANPYDPNNVYITDEGAGEIRSTRDGGQTWRREGELTKMATTTNGEEFDFGCKGAFDNGRRFCPLQQMLFLPNQPEIRVAILFPGNVAFSRDAGRHWTSIDTLVRLDTGEIQQFSELIAHPYSGFYLEEQGTLTLQSHLYLALKGRGVIRIDWVN